MYSKTITYEDFNGVTRTEKFYFNLTQAELTEMELGTTGGYSEYIQRIVAAQDQPTIIRVFKELILKAYGVRSDDGRRFIKSKELSEEFSQTQAYSDMYMEFATDDKAAAEFVNGILPNMDNIKNKIEKINQ